MKPDFALNLSHDGLALLHRQPDGWCLLGDVALDDPAMTGKLGDLRRQASDLAAGDFGCKLVIPNSQVLYRRLDRAELETPANDNSIREALDGTTPYPVDELAFDWITDADGVHHVAAVARETLAEAEMFATEHDFNPVSFVAIPDHEMFPGEPFFGPSELSNTLLGQDEYVEPDIATIAIVQAAAEPAIEQTAETSGDNVTDTAGFKVPPAPPADELPASLEVPDLPDAEVTPDSELPAVEGEFSTRRSGDTEPTMFVPDPTRPAARFMLYADKLDARSDELPDLGLGAATKSETEISEAGITARSLPGEKRRQAAKKKRAPKRQNPPMVAAMSGRPDPIDDQPAPEPNKTGEFRTRRGALDGDNLTVFGARRTANERQKPLPLAVFVGLGAVVVVLLAVLAWAFYPTRDASTDIASIGTAPALTTGTSTLDVAPQSAVSPTGDNGILIPNALGDLAPETLETQALTPPIDGQSGDQPPQTNAPLPAASADETLQASLDVGEPAPGDGSDLYPDELGIETARAIHAETGIWPLSPAPPVDLDTGRTDDIYIASIDRQILNHDAVALPSGRGSVQDFPLREMLSPPPAGTTFDLDSRGFVRALPQGAITPQGIRIFEGPPSTVPSLRPGSAPVQTPETDAAPLATPPATRPIARPEDIIEKDEKARLGGRTLTQLATIRPLARPASAQDINILEAENSEPTDLAVLTSPAPRSRPSAFSSIVEKALAEALAAAPTTTAVAAIAAPSTPSIPTRASVARAATQENAINLSQVNLIGIYGSSSDRRALVRLKSGRFVKVQIGDRLDGGNVAAISTNRLQYTKRGQTLTLEISS